MRRQHPVVTYVGNTLLGLAAVLTIIAPRGAHLWLIVTALALCLLYLPSRLHLPRLPSAAAVWLVAAAWAALSTFWSAAPGETLLRAFLAAALILIVTCGAQWAARAPAQRLQPAINSLVVGLAAGLAYILTECATHLGLTTLVVDKLEFLRPAGKHIMVTNGEVVNVGEWFLNRSLSATFILLWPGLLLLATRKSPWSNTWPQLTVIALAGTAALYWVHESSQVAFAAGLVVFTLASLRLAIGRYAVIAGWLVVVLFIIPIMHGLFAAKLHTAEWLPLSARARVVLWHYTADKYLEAPIIGIGARSTKIDFKHRDAHADWPKGYPYPLQTGRHSHNVFLQTWYELGAIGAVLLFIAGLATIRVISQFEPFAQRYALAAFTSTTALASSSYGLWQSWFLSLITLAAMLTCLGARAFNSNPDKP